MHHRWLLEKGAGDIISKRKDTALTLSVLGRLLHEDRNSISIYHSFKHAMRAAGDDVLRAIIGAMDPEAEDAESITDMSSLLENLDTQSISPALALQVARDERLPRQARLRGYDLSGSQLENAGEALATEAFEQADWDRNCAARELIELHADPASFLERLLRMPTISVERRVDLAASIGRHVKEADARRQLARRLIAHKSVESEVRIALRLMEARYGDAEQFRALVEEISSLPVQHAATTIALFGHYPERTLAEEAAALVRARAKDASEITRIAASATTGMRHVFEMDWGFSGVVRAAPPHAGIAPWIALLEDWSDRADLSPQDRMRVRTVAAGLGSESIAAVLERDLLEIDDFDDAVWKDDDELGHTISSALRQIRRRLPAMGDELIERLLRSSRYNIAMHGIGTLNDRGDEVALQRLVEFHRSKPERHLRDTTANTIEQVAARLQIVVRKDESSYRLE